MDEVQKMRELGFEYAKEIQQNLENGADIPQFEVDLTPERAMEILEVKQHPDDVNFWKGYLSAWDYMNRSSI